VDTPPADPDGGPGEVAAEAFRPEPAAAQLRDNFTTIDEAPQPRANPTTQTIASEAAGGRPRK